MNIETLLFKEIIIFPELFLGISIIYLTLHSTFLAIQKEYPLIQSSVLYLSVLILIFAFYLVYNEHLNIIEISCLNNTYIADYMSFVSKLIIGSLSVFCLLMMHSYILNQQINNFEYFLLFLFSVLGLFLLCSSNDLLTAYLAIELQSLSFYVLAAFKKNSTFSVDAGIKYFILGAFASSMFLFGSSLLYGFTGSISFDDFQLLFLNVVPGENKINIEFDKLINEVYCDLDYLIWREYHELISMISDEEDKMFMVLEYYQFLRGTFTNFNFLNLSDNLILTNFNSFDVNLIKFALIFILIALFFKLTVAPFHIWAPDVYEGSPSSSTFFFSVVPKLAVFVLLVRIFYFSFYGFVDHWRHFIVLIVIFSILVGSFGGLEQRKLKTLLVYSTISHMGYSLIAFPIFSQGLSSSS